MELLGRVPAARGDVARADGAHYPGGGWVRLESATLDRLAERKAAAGLPSYDATIAELLG